MDKRLKSFLIEKIVIKLISLVISIVLSLVLLLSVFDKSYHSFIYLGMEVFVLMWFIIEGFSVYEATVKESKRLKHNDEILDSWKRKSGIDKE